MPPVPISFAVATVDGQPARDAAWIHEQVEQMEALFGPLGVHPEQAAIRAIGAKYAHMESRADRDALVAGSGRASPTCSSSGRSATSTTRRAFVAACTGGIELTPTARYVILAAEAMPAVLAHEMGHYFGNGHSATVDNLMSYNRTGGPVFLDAAQGRVIQAAARQAFASGELVPAARR